MIILKKILVTTDLSDHSLAALEYASTLSLLYGAKLYLLHVEDVGPSSMYPAQLPDFYGEQFNKQAADTARWSLERFAGEKIKPDLNITLAVRLGDPVDEIVRFAEEERADMIVMATHGRTGLSHALMGSVAEKVVRRSTVPVLTVKPKTMREQIVSTGDVEEELHVR
jgi:nucleotide-binding universal stress UspA family protein